MCPVWVPLRPPVDRSVRPSVWWSAFVRSFVWVAPSLLVGRFPFLILATSIFCMSMMICLPPQGTPPPHSSRYGPQHTQHTASTAATPPYPQGRRQIPADAPTPLKRSSTASAAVLSHKCYDLFLRNGCQVFRWLVTLLAQTKKAARRNAKHIQDIFHF